MEQLIIPKLIYLFILITYLVDIDIVLILSGEILSWSLMGVEGLIILTKLATVKGAETCRNFKGKEGRRGGGESNWRWTDVTSRCTTEYTLAAWKLIGFYFTFT